ncbi:MAG: tetratricopeptide repeat protein [Syntrophaceae bacterium]|nr:tetratricopeptide repeat protein [Syntrophaceae bacterium]
MLNQLNNAVFQPQRVVRVFISSTFRDMQEERDYLITHIFQELRKLCRERGVEFVEVDLRWGITEEQAERGEILPVCLAEIEQCRPYFIGLLGERFGWVPRNINPALFEIEPWLREHKDKSITALEIIHGVLNNPETAKRSFFYFRDPSYLNRVSPDAREMFESEGPEAKRKLSLLKQQIRASGVLVRENYPDPKSAGRLIYEDLWKSINATYPPVENPDPLDRELFDHEIFGNSRLKIYIERKEYYARLDAHVKSECTPLVIVGESGCGKSALIANWANRYRKENPSEFLLLHFIGATTESTDYTRILQRIVGELKRHYQLPFEIPAEVPILCREFPNCLSMAAMKGKIILVLDALNQLDTVDNAAELSWLPEHFPANVRVILSCLPGPSLEVLQRRGYPLFRVEGLREDERKKLMSEYLYKYRKRLSEERTERIVSAVQTENPLYLRVLLDELRVCGLHEELDEQIKYYLETENAEELYTKVLARLEESYENERLGLVSETMELIWASRRGLSEREILELLEVPRALWSPLYLAIKDSLVVRSGLLGFYHNYLHKAVEQKYLTSESKRIERHLSLAGYFEKSEASKRKAEEFCWQLWKAGAGDKLAGALSDLSLSKAVWNNDQYDLFTYWAFLEGVGFKKDNAYGKVAQDPLNYKAHLSWLSELFYRAGNLDDSLKIREAQAKIFQKLGKEGNLAATLRKQAMIHRVRGNLDEAMRLLNEGEKICRELGNKNGIQESLGIQAMIHRTRGNLDEAMILLKEKEKICRELGNKNGIQASLGNQAMIYRTHGNLDEAMILLKEKEKICRELGNKNGLSISLRNQAMIHRTRGNLDEAMILHKDEEKICMELGNKNGIQESLGNQAMIHRTRGNLDEAMILLKEKEKICRELGNKNGIQASLGNQAMIHKTHGNLDEAMILLKEKEKICRELGNKNGIQESLGLQAMIHRTRGNLDEALKLLKEKEKICTELGNKNGLAISLGNQAIIHRMRGNLDEALKLHKEGEMIYRDLGHKNGIQQSLGNQAKIHRERGNLDEALRLLKEKENICTELGNQSSLANSLWNQALILYEGHHKPENALPLATEALRLFKETGMKPQVLEVEKLVSTLRGEMESGR